MYGAIIELGLDLVDEYEEDPAADALTNLQRKSCEKKNGIDRRHIVVEVQNGDRERWRSDPTACVLQIRKGTVHLQ